MRILVDVLHPAHVHFFGNFRQLMLDRGHEIKVVSRDKEITVELLEHLGIDHEIISRQNSGKLGLAAELLGRTWRLMRIAKRWNPDVLTGIMGPSITLAGSALGIPSVVFYDTEHSHLTNSWVYRLASSVVTPDCYEGGRRENFITYAGYQELAYLHPNRFTPNPDVVREFGLDPTEPILLLRFVSSQASHDVGQPFLTNDQKIQVANRLSRHGQLCISSETPLPNELEGLRLRGPFWQVHHLLSAASIVLGESATMCTEAAVLGTPAVYVAETSRGYLNDLQRRYGLVSVFKPDQVEPAIERAEQILDDLDSFSMQRQRLLTERIDVTAWMTDLFESQGF